MTLHAFSGNLNGANPYGNLLISSNILYGTVKSGCTNLAGGVFAMNSNGTNFNLLHSFNGSDGQAPVAGLTLGTNALYGTTLQGGTNSSGVVFTIHPDGSGFTVLHNFSSSSDGSLPYANLTLSGTTLYGATSNGGTNSTGTIFSLNTNGQNFTVLHTFIGSSDGAYPYGTLVVSGNMLYGTAQSLGTNGYGTVFALLTNGANFTVLHTFQSAAFGFSGLTNSEGCNPNSGLVLSSNILYGTTPSGGTNGYGTVFSLNTNGANFTVLHTFAGSDGSIPDDSLILSGSTLYGTTYSGTRSGSVFSLTTNGSNFTTLYSFTGGNDGGNPYASVVLSSNILYGTTVNGGSAYGTVFGVSLSSPFLLSVALSGKKAIVSWPTNSTPFTLQFITNLASPIIWNPVTNTPFVVNGQWTVTNPASSPRMFFRLSE